MLKGKLFDFYVSKNGNDVFKYAVTGTPEEVAQFEASQTVVHKQEGTDAPIYFSPRNGGNTVELGITTNTGKVFIKNLGQRKVLNVIKNNSDNLFGQALASEYAKRELDEMLGARVTSSAPAKKAAPAKTEEQPADEVDPADDVVETPEASTEEAVDKL